MKLLHLSIIISLAAAVVIPGPAGPFSVALKTQAFEDSARWDPYAPKDKPERRRVLTSAYIPMKQVNCSNAVVPYMPPTTAKVMGRLVATLGVADDILDNLELEFCELRRTCSSERDAPKDGSPLVLFSPGRGGSRLLYGALARTLASHGYVVMTMDHTYETSVVEFPDGDTVYGINETNSEVDFVRELIATRQADVSFLIDQLTTPSVAAELLEGTTSSIDSQKIFVYGHSLGGATSAASVNADSRVLGGLNFDGLMLGPVTTEGTDRPLVFVGSPSSVNKSEALVSSWSQVWKKLRGPALMPIINGTEHNTFLDAPQLPTVKALLPEYGPEVAQVLGTIDGDRAAHLTIEIVRAALNYVFKGDKARICNIQKLGSEIDVVKTKGWNCD